jgi:hypothetical protein
MCAAMYAVAAERAHVSDLALIDRIGNGRPCATRAAASDAMLGFVEALGRRLARGRALADEITADVVPVPLEGDSKQLSL